MSITVPVTFNVWWINAPQGCSVWVQGECSALSSAARLHPPIHKDKPFTATHHLPINSSIQWWIGTQTKEWVEWSNKRRILCTASTKETQLVCNWVLWENKLGRKILIKASPSPPRTLTRQHSSMSYFFDHLHQNLSRNYIVIVDRSVSMEFRGKWQQAGRAVEYIAQYACRCDPDGITLYLFDNEFQKWDGVVNVDQVKKAFSSCLPRGSTNLAGVLKAAFEEHFKGNQRATTILVVTDGEPNSKEAVKECIAEVANRVEDECELRVSFVQIGDDQAATRFLKELDEDLQVEGKCAYDIVDTINFSDMSGMPLDKYLHSLLPSTSTSSSNTKVPLPITSELTFLDHIRQGASREYSVLVDRSLSMEVGRRWIEAGLVVEYISTHACKLDPNGITLYLFDTNFKKWDHIVEPSIVKQIFQSHPPQGSTNLFAALSDSINEHFQSTRRSSTILVITDGEPNSKSDVKNCIIDAANKVNNDSELRISFVQIGNDTEATKFLKELDNELQREHKCAHDLVDVLTFDELGDISFDRFLQENLKAPLPNTARKIDFNSISSPHSPIRT